LLRFVGAINTDDLTAMEQAMLRGDDNMQRQFTLEYWIDDGWYVGKLKEVHGVFSQGETLNDLEENIRAYL
jgi:hypothetical protein